MKLKLPQSSSSFSLKINCRWRIYIESQSHFRTLAQHRQASIQRWIPRQTPVSWVTELVGPVGRIDEGRVFCLLNFFILPSSLFPHRFIPLFWHVIKNKQLYSLWSGAVLAAVSLYITNSNRVTQPRKTKTFYLTWDFKNYMLHPHTADIPVFSNRKESQSSKIVLFLLFN